MDRRSAIALIGAAGVGAGIAACDSGGKSGLPKATAPAATATGHPTATPGGNSASASAEADLALRADAVADEQRLLLACAAPAGLEPFATLRSLHLAHLRVLTSAVVTPPPSSARPPAAATLAGMERALAVARRTDCGKASASLAPLLASLAASGNVAATLLLP